MKDHGYDRCDTDDALVDFACAFGTTVPVKSSFV